MRGTRLSGTGTRSEDVPPKRGLAGRVLHLHRRSARQRQQRQALQQRGPRARGTEAV